MVRGFEIPFNFKPIQNFEPQEPSYSDSDRKVISDSVLKLLKSGAIINSEKEPGDLISTIFTVPKPDGSRRPILNLKNLNQFIECPHFKMETVKSVLQLVSLRCLMNVIDLKDAYHAIPISVTSQKYLKFRWEGKLYAYTCMPFGLCLAPYLFTN